MLNGANVTDPVTGIPDVRLPIDVVSSVEVIPNPYDPEYGRLTGAVAKTETRTGNYEGFHASFQNILPRPRKRGGDFVGIESFTPRLTVTGPLLKDKLAFTQSLEYRYVRTGISTQPPLQRDTKLETFHDKYSTGGTPDLLVRAVQVHLMYKRFAPGTIDGVAGPRTIAAVKAFQISAGDVPDGIIDDALLADLAKD